MKDNERKIIERKKQMKKSADRSGDGDDDLMYDPILDDLKTNKMKAGRQGDTSSGLDAGLEAFEGMSFAPSAPATNAQNNEKG